MNLRRTKVCLNADTRTIWVVSELYYPEETSTGHFMTKIAEGLGTEFPVRALCAQPSYSRRGTRVPAREYHNGVDIWRCSSTTFNKDHLALRVVNLVTISISIFVTALAHFQRGDYVLVVTNPPLLPYVTMLACRLRDAKCIVRVDDVYPHVLVAAGVLKIKSIPYRILDWLTRQLYYGAERIVVLGRDMKELISRKMSHHHERIRVITNWADLDLISPAPKRDNILLDELGLTDKFIVQWAGNMGHPHEVKSLLEAMIQLRDNSDIHFLFIGSGSKRAWLESQVKQTGLKNATFLANRPRGDQPNFLNACDLAISSLIAGMSGISMPSRTYNILAAGKPILAIGEPDSELGLVIAEERVGWIVPPGQSDQIVHAILEARAQPVRLAEMGKRGRAVVEMKYSSESVINKYIGLIKDLSVSGSTANE
jgi:glycosyltransferase involved in cell wall biosynthesis